MSLLDNLDTLFDGLEKDLKLKSEMTLSKDLKIEFQVVPVSVNKKLAENYQKQTLGYKIELMANAITKLNDMDISTLKEIKNESGGSTDIRVYLIEKLNRLPSEVVETFFTNYNLLSQKVALDSQLSMQEQRFKLQDDVLTLSEKVSIGDDEFIKKMTEMYKHRKQQMDKINSMNAD